MNSTIKEKTIHNFFWRFAERCGAQIVGFIVSLVLARILTPEQFGSIALIIVFTSILQVFVDSGLGNALIQKKEVDNIDYSSVFFFNIVFCFILYLLIFFLCPLIAKFYNDLSLIPVIRVLSLVIVISGLKNVQQAYVARNLIFKKFFFSTLTGTVVAAIFGILLALNGAGIWALVIQQLLNMLIDTIILWCTVGWKPEFKFSISRLKVLFSFGWKLLLVSLIDTLHNDVRQLIIGKMYSSSDLAFYNKARQFPSLVGSNVNTSIESVLFPVLSTAQDDKEKLKEMTRKSMSFSSFVMWPLLLGIAAVSKNLIPLLLTEKWNPCIPFLYIACFDYGILPFTTTNLNAIKALGRSDISLKLEIIKKAISLLIIFLSMKFGVLAIAIGGGIYSIISTIINSYHNRKLLDYKYLYQLKDILPYFLSAFCMFLVVNFLPLNFLSNIIQLVIRIFVGIFIYWLLSFLFKFPSYNYLLDILKRRR